VNAKKMYIEICYCARILPFTQKNNLDKNCPYKILEQEICSLRNEGSILLLGDFNARTATNQAIILRNDSNPNLLGLEINLIDIREIKKT
jgi:hypothetical protein